MKGTVTIDRSMNEKYDTLTVEQGGARLRVVADRRTFTGGPEWMATQLYFAAKLHNIHPDRPADGGMTPPLDDPEPGPIRTHLELRRRRAFSNEDAARLFCEAARAAGRLGFPATLEADDEGEVPQCGEADITR
jgi:hypothetical protein